MNFFDGDSKDKEAIKDYKDKSNYIFIALIIIAVIVGLYFLGTKYLQNQEESIWDILGIYDDDLNNTSYNAVINTYYNNQNQNNNINQTETQKVKHVDTNSYIFKEGEEVSFDKYDLIVSVPRISSNNELDYVVNIESQEYGTLAVSYQEMKLSKNNYVLWDHCKIEIIKTSNPSRLLIKITSLEEFGKQYKKSVGINLTLNEPYVINNSIKLLYNKRILDGEYSITVTDLNDKYNVYNFKNISLTREAGFQFVYDDYMIELEDDSDPIELKLIIYYN